MESKNATNSGVVILNVPFKEKDAAKELGAWWDPQKRRWFVPRGKDPKPFSKWIDSTEDAAKNR